MTQLTPDEIEEVSEVFDLFDFWDGRDGQVDGDRVGDWLRCCGLNPTNDLVLKTGGEKMNDKSFTLDELLPIFHDVSNSKVCGTFADFMEAFKTFDREGQGFISSAELRHVLTFLGEKLNDEQVDDILKWTETQEDLDGNCKYEEFIKKVMDGPKK